jgi:hypothetical protein
MVGRVTTQGAGSECAVAMMTGYEAAERIAKVLRANGVQDSNRTRYGLGYLIENALRHMASKSGAVAIQAGSNPNPDLKYE